MKTVIIGPGRLGMALYCRSVANGHETRLLGRYAGFRRTEESEVQVEDIARADGAWPDLVVLAAPAAPDLKKEAQVSAFVSATDPNCVICSAVAYAGAPHDYLASIRPYVQFLCTPAAAIPTKPCSLLVLDQNRDAQAALLRWFGSSQSFVLPRARFEKLTALFMATIVHLATLEAFLDGFDAEDVEAAQVAQATLAEAQTLLEHFDLKPARAIDACATAGGLTERMTRSIRRPLEATRALTGAY